MLASPSYGLCSDPYHGPHPLAKLGTGSYIVCVIVYISFSIFVVFFEDIISMYLLVFEGHADHSEIVAPGVALRPP